MAYIPLKIPAGVYRNGTEYQSAGRWYDSNLVRWYQGTIRPVGGWQKRSNNAVSGKARGLLTWRDNSNDRWIGIGTHTNLYVMNEGGSLYDITPTGYTAGNAGGEAKLGYGYLAYGSYNYGTPRPDIGEVTQATTWSLDTWGAYLIACANTDGKIYEWQLSTGTDAAVITNAPTNCTGVVVTAERFIFALGAGGDKRKVQWCDQENNTTWTPAATNQAGDFNITSSGSLMCGKRVRGLTVLFTDVDVHTATYIGAPYVYSFDRVGTGCGVISKQSVASTDNACIWMSRSGFWVYDGVVKPLPCDVGDFVLNDVNYAQESKIYCVHNSAYGEVWWFYPSGSSTEVDAYVSYNYREGHWAIGNLARTAGTDRGVFTYPLMVSTDGYVYEHETGLVDYETDQPYAKSGPVDVSNGDTLLEIDQIIPDEKTLGDVNVTFESRLYPTATARTYGPYSMSNPTSVRITGRQISAKIGGARNADWRIGTIRFNGKASGSKR
jgi:hypothetical protein